MTPGSPAVRVLVSVGSNVGRERNVPEALRRLRRHPALDVEAVSRVFRSAAVGGPDGAPDFFNAAVLARTHLSALQLRDALRQLEAELGRVRTEDPNAPRTIDLDLVFYGDTVTDAGGLVLPDPAATGAAHVAVPCADVAPDWVDPRTGRTIAEAVRALGAVAGAVVPVDSMRVGEPQVSRAPSEFDDSVEVYAPAMEDLVRLQLVEMGEDPEREGLRRTPLRVAKAYDFLTSGYGSTLDEVVNGAVFAAGGAEEMVLVRDIEFYSLCEHHMLPFFGRAAVAYLPKGHIIGLSKIARIVDLYARRLQVQERLTNQVADAVEDVLGPFGAAVVIEGRHFCMMMRGVQKQDSSMITSAMRGTFRSDARTRSEFLSLIAR